jgi:hypothetical protein
MFYNYYIDNEIYFNNLVNINNKKYYSVAITNKILQKFYSFNFLKNLFNIIFINCFTK